jgi:uncharacterized phage-like protein YoqJ
VSGHDQDVLKSLPQSVLSNLAIKKFILKSANQYIDSTVEQYIVPGKMGFYIGAETLAILLENFRNRNGSINSFLHALQVNSNSKILF